MHRVTLFDFLLELNKTKVLLFSFKPARYANVCNKHSVVCSQPSPAAQLTVGPHLLLGAAILLRLFKQAVALDEAIFGRILAVRAPVTSVPCKRLVRRALRHRRRSTYDSKKSKTIELNVESCMNCEKTTDSTPTLFLCRTSQPEITAHHERHWPMALLVYWDRLFPVRGQQMI